MARRLAGGGGDVKGRCLHCPALAHSFQRFMTHRYGTTSQRIRIGVTGLAIAFLCVVLGSVVSRSGHNNDPLTAQQNAALNEPSEPLAELGVAPGSTAKDAANTSSNAP